MFDTAIEIIFKYEGEYTNTPDDPGGETKYGISKRSYPGVDIANLTKEQAKEIYKRDFWDKSICPNLQTKLAIAYFDIIVNHGHHGAGKILQRAINRTLSYHDTPNTPQAQSGTISLAINRTLSYHDTPIEVDGIVGPITENLAMIYETTLLDPLTIERIQSYVTIAQKMRTSRRFLPGWINRALDIQQICS